MRKKGTEWYGHHIHKLFHPETPEQDTPTSTISFDALRKAIIDSLSDGTVSGNLYAKNEAGQIIRYLRGENDAKVARSRATHLSQELLKRIDQSQNDEDLVIPSLRKQRIEVIKTALKRLRS